jgi:hypothetical protein
VRLINITIKEMGLMRDMLFMANVITRVSESVRDSLEKNLNTRDMYTLLIIPFMSLVASCSSQNIKFVRKQIDNDDIRIKWFYYSYISNTSPDFVVVTRQRKEKEIYEATRVIIDVRLSGDSIILKLVEPEKGLVYTKQVEKKVFGYKIILDTTGTYEELQNIPDAVKEESN